MPQPWVQYAQQQQQAPQAIQPSAVQQNASAPWEKYAGGAGDMSTPPTAPPQTMLQKIDGWGEDLAKGVGEGALKTISTGDDWARQHLPAFMTNSDFGFGPPANEQRLKDLATPADTLQKIGKFGEQAGEFLIPVGAEEQLAKTGENVLSAVPKIAKYAPTVAKVGASALGAGAVNKFQGGSFGAGAGAGAVGAGIGAGLQKIAPVLAETALKVRGADRAYGATPGRAILDETDGFAPRKIVDSARGSLNGLQAEQGNLLSGAPNPIYLGPTRVIGRDFLDRAVQENHPGTIKELTRLNDQVNTEHMTGKPLSAYVFPSRAAALNRGLSSAITSWNPATATDTMNTAGKMMHHQLGDSIAEEVPEIRPLNQRIQSLMPVVQRGTAADLNAGFMQRSLGRLGAHTGALTGSAFGTLAGYREGGVPGAIAGGLLGIAAPEALASPEMQMLGARTLNSPALRKIAIPAAAGAGLQLGRSKLFDLGPNE